MCQAKLQKVISALEEIVMQLKDLLQSPEFNFDDFYIAGGCIYSLWNDKEPKDYDVFCKNKRAVKFLKKYFADKPWLCQIVTDNAITSGKFQFITRKGCVGNPDTQVGQFDFKHNMFYFNGKEVKCVSGWEFLDSDVLHFNTHRPRDILNTIGRIMKFQDRGMRITQKEVNKILEFATRPSRIIKERRSLKRRIKYNSSY